MIVENNLQKKNSIGEVSSGIGLENINKRYTFLTDKQIEISEAENTFSVKVPIID